MLSYLAKLMDMKKQLFLQKVWDFKDIDFLGDPDDLERIPYNFIRIYIDSRIETDLVMKEEYYDYSAYPISTKDIIDAYEQDQEGYLTAVTDLQRDLLSYDEMFNYMEPPF